MGKKRKGRLKEFQRAQSEISTGKAREERQEKIQRLRDEEETRAARKKKKKVVWNKARIITLVVILFAGAFVSVSLKNIISLKIEQNRLEKENERLIEEKAEKQEELKNANTRENIERQAREILKMVKPNEKIFIIEDKE